MARSFGNPKPSDGAEEVALNAWAEWKTAGHCVDLIADTGETVSKGQVTAIIERARGREDPRAIRHNKYATVVKAA